MTRIIAIDVETTGLSPARGDRVIEIAAVIVEGGRLVDEFTSLIRVDHPIHPAAHKVHGISALVLRNSPRPDESGRNSPASSALPPCSPITPSLTSPF